MAFTDHVAARLGRAIGAPVPEAVALVDVPQELIAANPVEMAHMQPGVGHGTKMIDVQVIGLPYSAITKHTINLDLRC